MTEVPVQLKMRPATLLNQVRWLVDTQPDAPAVVLVEGDAEKTISYSELFRESARYAAALEDAGVQSGDLVALIMQHGEDVLYAFWGAMLLGAIPSIFPFLSDRLDPARYFDSVRQLVEHEGVRVVVTYSGLESDLRQSLDAVEVTIFNTETLSADNPPDVKTYVDRNPATAEDTAFLQHSSGSTGLQKGVMLSHRAVLNQVAAYGAAIRLSPDDVIVSWLPLYHDMGLIAAFIMPMLQGVKLVLMSPFRWVRDPKMLLHAITRHDGTLCWLPNFAYTFLATRIRDEDLVGVDLASMRAFINCSEPVYAQSHADFRERFTPYGLHESALTVCYAMAENTFAVTQAGIDAPVKHDVIDRRTLSEDHQATPAVDDAPTLTFVSNGKPIPNCEIRVVDDSIRDDLPERRVGEIALRSDSMLSGYYKRPDASADAMQDGWYFTGDMGYIAEGELYITGRKKDLIIVGGKNVYPQDIENLLNGVDGLHPGRATAFGVFNDKLGTEDVAIVAEISHELDPDDRQLKAQISREIRGRVAQNTEVTARYVHLVGPKWLVKTSSGKVARRANRQKFIDDVLGE